jgi:hypothetical protein
MSRTEKPAKSFRLFSLSLIVLLVTAAGASGQLWKKSSTLPLCSKIANKQLQASSGAQMACFGPQSNGAAPHALSKLPSSGSLTFGASSGDTFTTSNVDAGNPSEDQTNGTQAYGQSEVSIAAAGPYVVEAWNDATGFFAPLCSAQYKDQLTGFGFSSDGGKTFTDMGGLPNVNCRTSVFDGDPSVEVYQTGGHTYFYVSSLFFNTSDFAVQIAMDVCEVLGSSLSCNVIPVIIADPGLGGFDDKDFLSIDAKRGLLYASYTNLTFTGTTFDQIQLSVCDIGNGALGGTPTAPVCNSTIPTPAYLTVASAPLTSCAELEGSYPAVDPATGDVYVAYESNWATNLSLCFSPVQDVMNFVPASCIALPGPTSCTGPAATNALNIVSMDGAFIAGYNRFPMNDFPRIAVSHAQGTVSMVWNDASSDQAGDVLLQSFALGTLAGIQAAPVKLNNDKTGTGAFHFLPALRNVDAHGNLNVTWFDRRLNPNTGLTDVYAALGVNPRTTTTPKSNTRVTNVSSNWLANNSDIIPNFGDYTDNYVERTSGSGLTARIFAAWSDGRINDPQPFNAHQGLK